MIAIFWTAFGAVVCAVVALTLSMAWLDARANVAHMADLRELAEDDERRGGRGA